MSKSKIEADQGPKQTGKQFAEEVIVAFLIGEPGQIVSIPHKLITETLLNNQDTHQIKSPLQKAAEIFRR